MNNLLKSITALIASSLFLACTAMAETKSKNPILGTWILVSCEPNIDNPCTSPIVPIKQFSKLIFKSKHMEFENGDVLAVSYIIEDGEVIVNSEAFFNAEKFTFPNSLDETTLNFRHVMSGQAIMKYKRP